MIVWVMPGIDFRHLQFFPGISERAEGSFGSEPFAPKAPVLRRNRDLGVTRMMVRLPPAREEEILPILDRWAKLIPQVKD